MCIKYKLSNPLLLPKNHIHKLSYGNLPSIITTLFSHGNLSWLSPSRLSFFLSCDSFSMYLYSTHFKLSGECLLTQLDIV
ncbi:hypothetical protein MtrunA17_Chr1g0159331 [Medicago truncatula]|uniref:Uncharacterized protein n=1 Tax=Medicago truncatula TaxID=3880 RepID=A0A396JNM2_MEDTR|nr:hypothetical protein MtrunA17_Chr1g0159331 [Medicago truncatula]